MWPNMCWRIRPEPELNSAMAAPRCRRKLKLSISAETESRTESDVRLSAEAECLPLVRWYFRPKTKPKVDLPGPKAVHYGKETHQYTTAGVT